MSGYVIAVIGDTHIGSSTALSPLQFTIHNRATLEEQITYANRLQEWLHECWVDYWDYIYHLCSKGKKGKRLIVIHLGDVIDGNHSAIGRRRRLTFWRLRFITLNCQQNSTQRYINRL